MSLLIVVFISCFSFVTDPITEKFSAKLSLGLLIYIAIPSLDTLSDLLVILSLQFANWPLMISCIFFYMLPNFMLFRDLYREGTKVRFPFPVPSKLFFENYDTIYKLLITGIVTLPWVIINSWFWFPWLLFGCFLYSTKVWSIGPVKNFWLRVWTGSDKFSTKLVINPSILNESIYLEIVFETFPQLIIQIINNTMLGNFNLF